jgi:serine/threonine-protein kinase
MTERFELLEQVGRGGMGAVWKARDTQTGDIVALKIPWEQFATDPAFVERLEREVALSRRVESPYVVRVLGFGRREGRPFIAMEYVAGRSLREAIREDGRMDWAPARSILRAVALGLEAAHRAGVIHRDVKPSNIILGGDGVPKLVDFGIATAEDLTALTGSKTTLGTPAYMPPEGAGTVQGDLYALGCVAYEMLTGRQVFEGDTQQEVMLKHIREQPDLSRLPPEARPVLGWLLSKQSVKRPPSARRLAEVLAGNEKVPRPAIGRLLSKPLALAGAGSLGIAAVGAGVAMWVMGGDGSEPPAVPSATASVSSRTPAQTRSAAARSETPGSTSTATSSPASPSATGTEGAEATATAATMTPNPTTSASATAETGTPATTTPATTTVTVTPTIASTGFTVSIRASATSFLAGQGVVLTAVSNTDVGETPYYIVILEDGFISRICGSGTACSLERAVYYEDTRTYTAQIGYPEDGVVSDLQAESGAVQVRWTGSATYSLSLSATRQLAALGEEVTITARAGYDVTQTPYFIVLFEDRVRVASCGFSVTCSYTVAAAGQSQVRTYYAVVGDFEGADEQARSNEVRVTWSGP